jgi:hypothetical protein
MRRRTGSAGKTDFNVFLLFRKMKMVDILVQGRPRRGLRDFLNSVKAYSLVISYIVALNDSYV